MRLCTAGRRHNASGLTRGVHTVGTENNGDLVFQVDPQARASESQMPDGVRGKVSAGRRPPWCWRVPSQGAGALRLSRLALPAVAQQCAGSHWRRPAAVSSRAWANCQSASAVANTPAWPATPPMAQAFSSYFSHQDALPPGTGLGGGIGRRARWQRCRAPSGRYAMAPRPSRCTTRCKNKASRGC